MLIRFLNWLAWLEEHGQPKPTAVYLTSKQWQYLFSAGEITWVMQTGFFRGFDKPIYKVAGVEIREWKPRMEAANRTADL